MNATAGEVIPLIWVVSCLVWVAWVAACLLVAPRTIAEDEPDLEADLASWERECAMHRHPAGRKQRRSE